MLPTFLDKSVQYYSQTHGMQLRHASETHHGHSSTPDLSVMQNSERSTQGKTSFQNLILNLGSAMIQVSTSKLRVIDLQDKILEERKS